MRDLSSDYDCSRASDDLQSLRQEWERLRQAGSLDEEQRQRLHRIENQMQFIQNKCDIH